MIKLFTCLILVILISMTSCFKYQSEKADLIVHNAKIYQVDNLFSIAEAMAIKDGKIIAIGPENEIRNKYNSEEVLDAKTRSIYPGFIDAHSHFSWYANALSEVDLSGSKSWKEVLDRTVAFAKNNNTSTWFVGRGWDQNLWEDKAFPNKKDLDSIFPNKAVLLYRVDAHAALANSKAMELSTLDQHSQLKSGKIEVINGETTGMLFDFAIEEVSKNIPKKSYQEMLKYYKMAESNCFAAGLTTVSDAYLQHEDFLLLDSLQKSGKLKIKINALLAPTEENKNHFLSKGPYFTDKMSATAFKYFADGALGSRGAKLIHDYTDDAGNNGSWMSDTAYLLSEAKLLFEKDFQMATHCIGDAANKEVLKIYAEVLKGYNDKRWRIEHVQVLQFEDIDKFGKYNIIPSIQPVHATSDMGWAQDRLGSQRMPNAYAYKKLLDQNGMIAIGTDFPIEDISPIKSFYAAVARKNEAAEPVEGFQMEDAISRKDAIRGMSIWAALANFEEDKKGSLEVGKAADFIILDRDLLEVEEENILSSKILATYLNGEKVY